MAIHVDHIRDVSFKNYFLDVDHNAPKNGSIQVNHNTFDVTFVDGKVNAKFASGNWFTNCSAPPPSPVSRRRSRPSTTAGSTTRRRRTEAGAFPASSSMTLLSMTMCGSCP